jgi:hypothetical protein
MNLNMKALQKLLKISTDIVRLMVEGYIPTGLPYFLRANWITPLGPGPLLKTI